MHLIDRQPGDASEPGGSEERPRRSAVGAQAEVLFGGACSVNSARGSDRDAPHHHHEMKGRHMDIYVGNIPLNATDRDLHDLFAEYGMIGTAAVSIDRETDQPLGFGLVELVDDSRAHEAVRRLDGSVWNGRKLVVSGAQAAVEAKR